jgi:hypothetical protein
LDAEIVNFLETADSMELLLNDPKGLEEKPGGYWVLGMVRLNEPETRKQVLSAIHQSVDEGNVNAFCFHPRHILRAHRGEKNVELVICFECVTLHAYRPEGGYLSYPISLAAEPLLKKILAEAGIKSTSEPR